MSKSPINRAQDPPCRVWTVLLARMVSQTYHSGQVSARRILLQPTDTGLLDSGNYATWMSTGGCGRRMSCKVGPDCRAEKVYVLQLQTK